MHLAKDLDLIRRWLMNRDTFAHFVSRVNSLSEIVLRIEINGAGQAAATGHSGQCNVHER